MNCFPTGVNLNPPSTQSCESSKLNQKSKNLIHFTFETSNWVFSPPLPAELGDWVVWSKHQCCQLKTSLNWKNQLNWNWIEIELKLNWKIDINQISHLCKAVSFFEKVCPHIWDVMSLKSTVVETLGVIKIQFESLKKFFYELFDKFSIHLLTNSKLLQNLP